MSGACLAARAVCDTSREADFFEAFAAAVGENEIGGRVVGNEKIEETVVVDVRRHYDYGGNNGTLGTLHTTANFAECIFFMIRPPKTFPSTAHSTLARYMVDWRIAL